MKAIWVQAKDFCINRKKIGLYSQEKTSHPSCRKRERRNSQLFFKGKKRDTTARAEEKKPASPE